MERAFDQFADSSGLQADFCADFRISERRVACVKKGRSIFWPLFLGATGILISLVLAGCSNRTQSAQPPVIPVMAGRAEVREMPLQVELYAPDGALLSRMSKDSDGTLECGLD